MKITDVHTLLIGDPAGRIGAMEGEFLVSPLHIFPDYKQLLGRKSVGLRGGPVYAVLVKVTTDEGVYGLGSVGVGSGSAAYVINHHLKSIVLGESPFDVEALWEKMFRSTLNYGRKGLVLEAISGIDLALWDIMGKAAGQPVYNLLGGKTRDALRAYASRLYAHEDLETLALQAEHFLQQGFTAMKQRFGYGPLDGYAGMLKNLELVKTVRSAVGPGVELMADAYMGWDVDYAIRMIRMLEDAGMNLRWVEEPLIPDDIDGYAKIRRSVSTPISGGEHEFTRYGFRELIRKEAVDILQPDVNRVGGITEARKIWALAATYNLAVIPHAGQLHNYHMVMAHLNSPMVEYFPPPGDGGTLDDDTLFWELFTGEPVAVGGQIYLGDRPGFGWELNEANVRKWEYSERS
ncbi:MAG TPA: enolase C-terminal domain-like protein [Terriglobales bacterium]|jgi:L-alanine-DL-glutamate epimerase-like enolase superfamily enzyme|nr:enolase C-terminal domain-like protein [Terriglobia bacterium]HZU41436.1 enolase C-terminal domain-like protein [Terriglobales bacterium]